MTSSEWVNVLARIQMLVLPTGFFLCLVLESLPSFGMAKPWKARWAHVFNNLGLWLASLLIFSLTIGNALFPVLPWMEMQRIGALYFLGLPTWLTAVLGFLLYDFFDYLFHRLSHEVRWLWILHAAHHADNAMDVSTHVRGHPVHFFTAIVWKTFVATAIGVPYWAVVLRELLAIPVVQLHHSAVRWPEKLDRLLRTVIVTPPMHRLHHSPEQQYTDSNYGSLVPWWDKLLRTYSHSPAPTGGEMPVTGLTFLTGTYWQSVPGMLLTPLAVGSRSERL